MWHYFWAHTIYHLARLCFKHRTRKCPLIFFLVFLSIVTALPQLWVIHIRDFYIMYCPFPIYTLVIVSLVFTIFMIGFSVIFVIMDPVEIAVKYAFHAFGIADLALGCVFVTYTVLAFSCIMTATEMYAFCTIIAVGNCLTTLYFLALVPLWVADGWVWRRRLLNREERDRALFGCIRTFPCLWHI